MSSSSRVKLRPRIRLRQNVPDDVAMDVGQAAVGAVMAEGQAFVIDAQKVQDRGVQIVTIQRLDGAPAPLVAFAGRGAPFDTGAGEPGDGGAAVVIASFGALGEGLPA